MLSGQEAQVNLHYSLGSHTVSAAILIQGDGNSQYPVNRSGWDSAPHRIGLWKSIRRSLMTTHGQGLVFRPRLQNSSPDHALKVLLSVII